MHICLPIKFQWNVQKWHLNRLLTLLRVCDLKNAPREKKMLSEIQHLGMLNKMKREEPNLIQGGNMNEMFFLW